MAHDDRRRDDLFDKLTVDYIIPAQALQLPLPPSYYLMTVLTTAAGYIFNICTDGVEDSVNYDASYLLFDRRDRWTVPLMLACYLGSNLCALVAGWPFDYWVAAQGAVLVFMAIVAVYAAVMKRLSPEDNEPQRGAGGG